MRRYRFDCGCEFDVLNESPLRLKFEPDIEKIPLDCSKTWEWIGEKSCKGIFQLDSQLSEHIVHQFKPKSIGELGLCVTISRPGCLDARTEEGKTVTQSIIDRKNGIEEYIIDEKVNDILGESFGHIGYQEQMMAIAAKLAGFDPGMTNKLRKAGAKKDHKAMSQLRDSFIKGCIQVGIITEEEAIKLFDNISASARYSFNKCLDPKTTFVENKDNQYISLEKLKVGEYIKGPSSFVKVIDKVDNGVQDCIIALVNNKVITCTTNHKFMCEDGQLRTIPECFFLQKYIKTEEKVKCPSLFILKSLKCPTVNIEVDSPDHLYYANGIVTQNSHAIEYALLSYTTAYIKCHFIKAFLTSSLKHAIDKQKPFEEICDLVGDARNNSIDVNPPDIRNLNDDFALINSEIYFGLGDIRGIGESVLRQLKEAVGEAEKKVGGRVNWQWLDFLFYVSPFINSTTTKALICSGALDFCHVARSTMYFEYEQFAELKDREQTFLINSYEKDREDTLIGLIGKLVEVPSGRKGGCSNIKRLEAVKGTLNLLKNPPFSINDSIEWLAGVEEELMGISLSCTKVDACDISMANCDCRSFINGYSRPGPVLIALKIDRMKEITTKNKQRMCFLNGSDITGSIDSIVVFPKVFEQYKTIIGEGKVLMLSGKRDEKNKSNLIVDRVWQL